jgi:DNA polymerase elongation subunit (family B)
MITLNISPETKIGKIIDQSEDKITIKDINDNIHCISKKSFDKLKKDEKIAISKANILFTQKKKGLFPEIIDIYYKQRVDAKKRLSKVNKLISVCSDKKEKSLLEKEAKLLDIKQNSLKIFLNSIYGCFGNKYFVLGDEDLARSITLSGQAIINKGSDILTDFVEKRTGRKVDREVIRYIDTDSLFFSFDNLLNEEDITFSENGKVTNEMYSLIDETSDFLNNEIKKWGEDEFNSNDCRIVFKREKICDVGMFLKKKHYILHILDNEGIPCNIFKYTGVDVVKSTMPKRVKPYVKNIAETLLSTMDNDKTNNSVIEAYDNFLKLPLEEISTIKGIKNYEKYSKLCNKFETVKGMPNHVKAAYYYNTLLDILDLNKKYEKIQSGDKIKIFYLKKPNKYGIDVIAFKYYYPEEFKSFFEADYEKMFEKVIFSPVEKFFSTINWVPRKPNNMLSCDIMNIFS